MKTLKMIGLLLFVAVTALGSAGPARADQAQFGPPDGFDCKYYNPDLAWFFFDWYGVRPEDCLPKDNENTVNTFDVAPGQKVVAYRGSCTVTTESAYAATTVTLGHLQGEFGVGMPKFVSSACIVLTDGILGDTTILTYAIKNRTLYDQFASGEVVLWYADGTANWAPCTTYIYGADLEAEGNPVFGAASCTITGAVTAFGPAKK
ncbi:MAG: hypothetical protein HYZ26_02195 [Chloroflexi bacterium]|nr:hypothetical protein [Chloroflexota bacterium]